MQRGDDAALINWFRFGVSDLGATRFEALVVDADAGRRRAVASNAHCPPEILERLARDPDPVVRAAAAHNRSLPTTLIADLATDAVPMVRASAAMALRIDDELLRMLATDSNDEVRAGVVSNNRSDRLGLVHALVTDQSPLVRRAVATKRDASRDHKSLSHDNDSGVRQAVAAHTRTPEVLLHLAGDADPEVRSEVLKNALTPPDALAMLANRVLGRRADDELTSADALHILATSTEDIEALRVIAGRVEVSADTLDQILVKLRRLSEAMDGDLRLKSVAEAIASNSAAAANTLETLGAEFTDDKIRLILAMHPNTPPVVLANISSASHDPTVWNAIIRHPNTDDQTARSLTARPPAATHFSRVLVEGKPTPLMLERLALSRRVLLRAQVAGNSKTPLGVLEKLVADPATSVRAAAAKELDYRRLSEAEGRLF